jgi:hypothetical protein
MGAVGGVTSKAIRSHLAYTPSPKGMPISLREQHRFPTAGANGESIKVPSGAPSRHAEGPQAPPGQRYLRVSAIMRDAQGRAMVVLQGQPGQQGAVLQVGDLYQGYRVERITNTEMELSKEEGGQTIREIVRLQVGGGRPGAGGRGGATPGPAQPGGATEGAGGGGTQPGIRRPGARQGGAFPGVGGGQNNNN